MPRLAALVRLYVLEAWRVSLLRRCAVLWLLIQLMAAALAALAITEAQPLRWVTLAFLFRLTLVLVLAFWLMTRVVRERDRGFMDVVLAYPIARWQYVLARLLAYGVMAGVAVLCVMATLAFWLPQTLWHGVLWWSASLGLELLVSGAMALFLALGLRHAAGAMLAWLGFYVLARLLDVARVMAAAPVAQDAHGFQAVAGQWVFEALSWVVPPLGSFTRAEWLLGQSLPTLSSFVVLALWALAYAGVCVVGAALDGKGHEG